MRPIFLTPASRYARLLDIATAIALGMLIGWLGAVIW